MTPEPRDGDRWPLLTLDDRRVGVRTPQGDFVIHTILGVGRNYAEHAAEQGAAVPDRPMIFTKNAASVTVPGADIVIPRACADREQVDYEGELAFVIGHPARDVPEERAAEFILGYCVANDVSARWWQKQGAGGQFFRGKSFDTFCPIGPALTPSASVPDPQALAIETRLNGAVVQRDSTASMIFTVFALVAELSRGTTLLPGTLILTGTPSGVGMAADPPRYLRDGDEIAVSIERLGTIVNRVRAE